MADTTKIEWADSTFNPWEGCTKVGPGCDHCYAETRNARFAGGHAINWGPGAPRRRTTAANWRKPLQWEREAAAFQAEHGRRRRVFCASLADVFDNEVDPAWRADLFALIRATPGLDWLLLTKRIGNATLMIEQALMAQGDGATDAVGSWPWANVWLGATIVNQVEGDRDIPKLLDTPAAVRFLSMEPLLGAVNVSRYMWPVCGWWRGPHRSYLEAKAAGAECGLKRQGLVWAGCRFVDWVIAGGESGPDARPSHPDWYRALRDQCAAAGVPYLFKQWGEWAPGSNWPDEVAIPSGEYCDFADASLGDAGSVWRVGKKVAGRLLDGVEHNGFPKA